MENSNERGFSKNANVRPSWGSFSVKVFVLWEQVKNLRAVRTMKRTMVAILIIFSFSWISVVFAGDFPGKNGTWQVKESH